MIVRALCARAGAFQLRDVTFELPDGGWGIVLGPTGAGKSTLLEAIAGVRPVVSGRVFERDREISAMPAEQRGVAMVYQHSYLFPHLSVDENVRYGAHGAAYAREVGTRFGVDALRDRPVPSLSGGERQVVALARALAPRPRVLLLDEPFAALDPRRRSDVRRELHLLQRAEGITVLHVTHDFAEAGTLGDVALVLEAGRLSQAGEPALVFGRPASASVAEFLGAENVFAGTIAPKTDGAGGAHDVLCFRGEGIALVGVGEHAGGPGHAVIRGSDIVLARASSGPTSARNVLECVVEEVIADGMLARVSVRVGPALFIAIVTRSAALELGLEPGAAAVASIKATAVHLC